MPAGFWMGAKNAKEYDDWAKDAKMGDRITISGKIAEKDSESIAGLSIYSYRMEDCKESFLSSEDIGNKGDKVTVEIEYRELGPEASKAPNSIIVNGPNICCGLASGILLIVGLLLFLIGMRKKKQPAGEDEGEIQNPEVQ
jgi:hypothetical protein